MLTKKEVIDLPGFKVGGNPVLIFKVIKRKQIVVTVLTTVPTTKEMTLILNMGYHCMCNDYILWVGDLFSKRTCVLVLSC